MSQKSHRLSIAGRQLLLLCLYVCVLLVSHWLAYQLRFDFSVPAHFQDEMLTSWPWTLGPTLILLYALGQFSGLVGYFSIPDFKRVLCATGAVALGLLGIRYASPVHPIASRGIILTNFLVSTVGIAGVRLGLRIARERQISSNSYVSRPRRIGIIGAGDVGASLAKELIARKRLGLQPVAFFDDAREKWNSNIHGIPVIGQPEMLREAKVRLAIDEIVIAMPSAPPRRIGEIVRLLQSLQLKFETVPAIDELATGKVRVTRLRPVEILDLLGREPVQLETESIKRIICNQVVLVTGAGGSIGSELCRQIASFEPKLVVLVERCEVLAFQIEQELIQLGHKNIISPVVADVCDTASMRRLFNRYTPAVVFHAAAHKHVPMMEHQPAEAIRNNTIATANLAELARESSVERFILISTDKAINPSSVMGATKRLAEMFLQALAAAYPAPTKFISVRFGNVLGSSGSVIPIFTQQIAAGGPVTVTHPEAARYFMTISEAVGLVLQSAALGKGGETFALDMGRPIKIVDLARQMIELSGFKPDEDIKIEFIGLRPGEKLFEEISYSSESYVPTPHPKIKRFLSEPLPLEKARNILNNLARAISSEDNKQLKLLLQRYVPEYQPFLD